MNEISVYIQYLINNPKKFLLNVENISNDTLLEILITIYNSKEYKIFDYVIVYFGQENVKYNIIQPYNKLLSVLRDNHMYAFKYTCKQILAPILNYQIESNKDLIPITLINLSVYPEYLSNAIRFIETQNKLNTLLNDIHDKKELKNHLIQSLNLFDKDLSNLINNYYTDTNLDIDMNTDIDTNLNNNKSNNNINNNLNLEKFNNNQNIIDNTLNDNLENEDYQLYLTKIKKDNKNLIEININKDYLIFNNKDKKGLNVFKNCINQGILFKSSKKKMDYLELSNLNSLIRDNSKDIIFCDGMDLLNSNLLSNKEYEFNIINREDQHIRKLELIVNMITEQSVFLTDKYSIVMVVDNQIFEHIFGASSYEDINMAMKDNIIFLSIGNNLEYEYLLLYLYMKIHKANDLLFSNKHFESVNHYFKSFINNEIVNIKKLVLENVKNVDLLITMLNG